MYTEFYRLRESPFNVTPDPKFLYPTQQHQTALNHLLYAIHQRKGFVVLTGEVGTGKTTLCRKLLEALGPSYHTALVLYPMLTPTQLLRAIVVEFGIQPHGRDRLAYLQELNAFLLSAASAGRDAVLVVDEAQDMSLELLEMTRLLSNLETNSRKLIQIVLAGQPELRLKLGAPSLRQLDQRITIRYHLRPMTLEETAGYLRHRLSVARGTEGDNPQTETNQGGTVSFEEAAIRQIHQFTGGTPRLVNALSDKALLAGYATSSQVITTQLVKLAMKDMREAA
jgi:general secretion pathway protein A